MPSSSDDDSDLEIERQVDREIAEREARIRNFREIQPPEDELRLFPDLGSLETVERPIRVRFVNYCPFSIDVFWMNARKEPTKYGRLGQKQYLDIQTFEKHPWVARRTYDGCKVLLNKKEVYWPQSIIRNNQVRSVIVRQNISITFKVQSLKDIAAYSLLRYPDIIRENYMYLPRELEEQLKTLSITKNQYARYVCQIPPPFFRPSI